MLTLTALFGASLCAFADAMAGKMCFRMRVAFTFKQAKPCADFNSMPLAQLVMLGLAYSSSPMS